MQLLPNGCSVSPIRVFPKNWKTSRSSVNNYWRGMYRFYDKDGTKKQITIWPNNKIKDYDVRKALMKQLIAQELEMLKYGYNPIKGRYVDDNPLKAELGNWSEAVKKTMDALNLAETTKRDMASRIGKLLKSAQKLGYSQWPISQVKKIHIKAMLKDATESAYSFNKIRSYLMMVYKELNEIDAVDSNIIRDIGKAKVTVRARDVLTTDERKRVNDHLKAKHYSFWRYLHIFYYSGARSTELLSVERDHVDLEGQRFMTLVKKGKEYREVWRMIQDVALPYWVDLLKEPGKYVFSYGLKPGENKSCFDTITKNWRKYVKLPLKITANWYSIKHLATTDMVDELGEDQAVLNNAHTSSAMVRQVYDLKSKTRMNESIKNQKSKFA